MKHQDLFSGELNAITNALAEVTGRMSKLQELHYAALPRRPSRTSGDLALQIEELVPDTAEMQEALDQLSQSAPPPQVATEKPADTTLSVLQELNISGTETDVEVLKQDILNIEENNGGVTILHAVSSLPASPLPARTLQAKIPGEVPDTDFPGVEKSMKHAASDESNPDAEKMTLVRPERRAQTEPAPEVSGADSRSSSSPESPIGYVKSNFRLRSVARKISVGTRMSSSRNPGVTQRIISLRALWEDIDASAIEAIQGRYIFGVSVDNFRFKAAISMTKVNLTLVGTRRQNRLLKVFDIMHPIAYNRIAWHGVSLVLILWDVFAIPLQAFTVPENFFISALEWIATLFWTLDMILMFRTGYIRGATVEMRPKQIAKHYARTWLVVDLLIVTVEWVSRFSGIAGSASLLRSSRLLKTVRFLKLLRLGKMREIYQSLMEQLNSNVLHLLSSMFILAIILMLAIHIASCAWYALGESEDDGWTTYDGYTGKKTFVFWYVESCRWVIAQLNGRTDINDRRNMKERLYTCFIGLTFAVLAKAVCTGFITKLMLDLNALVSSKTERSRVLNQYMESHPVCPQLQSSVKRYVTDYHDVGEQKENEDAVLNILPRHLRSELLVEVRSPVLVSHTLFHKIAVESRWSMRSLCCNAVTVITAVQFDIVFDKGEDCTRMLFLDQVEGRYGDPADPSHSRQDEGSEEVTQSFSPTRVLSGLRTTSKGSKSLDESDMEQTSPKYYSQGSVTSLLDIDSDMHSKVGQGKWISEPALWTHWVTRGRLVSTTHGHMYAVDVDDLASGLKTYPPAFALASLYGARLVEKMQESTTSTDILNFLVTVQDIKCSQSMLRLPSFASSDN